MPEFDLTEREWIPCLMKAENKLRELSLRDCLCRAHDIREIFDNSPLVTVALQRLLLAILHASFAYDPNAEPRDWRGPRSFAQWKSLWEQGRFDEAKVTGYLNHWRQRNRFNLFDIERPFFQVPQMQKAQMKKTPSKQAKSRAQKEGQTPKPQEVELVEFHPIALLAHELATGSNPTLFDHNHKDSGQVVSSAMAARYLLAQQAFAVSFGISHKSLLGNKEETIRYWDGLLARGLMVSVGGENLFESLLLNLIRYPSERPFSSREDDAPVWEQASPVDYESAGTLPKGYLDYLTWQSRSVYLRPSDDGLTVSHCQRQQRAKLQENVNLRDPFKCYEFEKDQKDNNKFKLFSPLKLDPKRALWRDSHTLLQQLKDGNKGTLRPYLFDRLAEIRAEGRRGQIKVKESYAFTVYGLATDPRKAASVIHWSQETLPLPLTYLSDPDLVQALQIALALADELHKSSNSRFGISLIVIKV